MGEATASPRASGYMGYVENEYILFASEDDYFDYMEAI